VNETVLDELPDDTGHLVAIEFNDRVHNLDLAHEGALLVRDWF
jgi:hypothetical protein